jgi:hypothetical protein
MPTGRIDMSYLLIPLPQLASVPRFTGRCAENSRRNREALNISAGQGPYGDAGKTVGAAHVGSNQKLATTCENGLLAADSRLCGPFLICRLVCRLVLSRCRCCGAVHRRIADVVRAAERSVRTVDHPLTAPLEPVFRLDIPGEAGVDIPGPRCRLPGFSLGGAGTVALTWGVVRREPDCRLGVRVRRARFRHSCAELRACSG